MLSFHEQETCKGIIRYLESREGVVRSDVRSREDDNTPHDARVEMTFRLGRQLYAIEHTGIEPFEGFVEHQNRAPALFAPLQVAMKTELAPLLAPGVVFELVLPIDAFYGYDLRQVRAMHAALVEYAKVTAQPCRRGDTATTAERW